MPVFILTLHLGWKFLRCSHFTEWSATDYHHASVNMACLHDRFESLNPDSNLIQETTGKDSYFLDESVVYARQPQD